MQAKFYFAPDKNCSIKPEKTYKKRKILPQILTT